MERTFAESGVLALPTRAFAAWPSQTSEAEGMFGRRLARGKKTKVFGDIRRLGEACGAQGVHRSCLSATTRVFDWLVRAITGHLSAGYFVISSGPLLARQSGGRDCNTDAAGPEAQTLNLFINVCGSLPKGSDPYKIDRPPCDNCARLLHCGAAEAAPHSSHTLPQAGPSEEHDVQEGGRVDVVPPTTR